MNMFKLCLITLFFVVLFLIVGCATTNEKIWKQQMAARAKCTAGNSCLGDILSSKPDLNNHKTRAAYNKKHKEVNKFMQSVKDCMAENRVQDEHGMMKSRDCSKEAFYAEQENKKEVPVKKPGLTLPFNIRTWFVYRPPYYYPVYPAYYGGWSNYGYGHHNTYNRGVSDFRRAQERVHRNAGMHR